MQQNVQAQQQIRINGQQQIQKKKTQFQTQVEHFYIDLSFKHKEVIPSDERDAMLQENSELINGRKLGTMEKIKAKKEYSKKRELAQKRFTMIDTYQSKRNQEVESIKAAVKQKNPQMELVREPYKMMQLLDQGDREGFIEDVTSKDDTRFCTAMDKFFDQFLEADLSILAFNNDDDLFQNYEEKRKLVDAGWNAKNMLAAYLNKGGFMAPEKLEELQVRIDYCQQMNAVYQTREELQQHPQTWMLRDQDVARLSEQEVEAKANAAGERITQLQDRLKNGQMTEKQKGQLTRQINRLTNLRDYLFQRLMSYKHQQSDTTQPSAGMSAESCLAEIREQRKITRQKQWVKDVKEMRTVQDKLGQYDGEAALVYMHRYHKTVSDLQNLSEEDEANMQQVWQELYGSKSALSADDPDKLAPVLQEMIKGFLFQFSESVRPGEVNANYIQLQGLSKTDCWSVGQVRDTHWGTSAAIHLSLYEMLGNIRKLTDENKEARDLVMQSLTEQERALYDKASKYLDRTGAAVSDLSELMYRHNLAEEEDIEQARIGELTDDEYKIDRKKEEQEEDARQFRFITSYLAGFEQDFARMWATNNARISVQGNGGQRLWVQRPAAWTGGIGALGDYDDLHQYSHDNTFEAITREGKRQHTLETARQQ
ncbi:MAG: hypothetical protein IJT34_04435 [Butyrivibrio sp.]|nr:hypothetical protein [Butyrivibrio sp.]